MSTTTIVATWLPPAGAVMVPGYPGLTWDGGNWLWQGGPYTGNTAAGQPDQSVTLAAQGVGRFAGSHYTRGQGPGGTGGSWTVVDSQAGPQTVYASQTVGSVQAQPPQGQTAMVPWGGGNGNGNGGYIQGSGAGVSTALIAQLLTGQQTAAAVASMMGQANTDAQAAAAAADLAPALASMQAGVAMAIGIQGTAGQSALLSSPNGLLFMLLGAQGVQQLASLVTAATKAFDTSGSTAATLGLAWDNFAKGIAGVLTSVQSNSLLATLASGQGGVGMGALLGIMMGQQALTSFSTAIGTNPPSTTLPTTKVNVAAFNNAFGTMLAALNTNQLLMALVPSS